MPCVDRKRLKKFYEEEAERLSHRELMYLKGCACICSEVLEHVPNCRKAFAELYRIARKYLVISFPGHSYIHKVISKANVLKRLVNNVIPDVGHVSEITVYDIKSLLKTYNYKASTEIKIGGALPLQLYKIIPCVKLVDVIDNMACKILKHFGATDYVTTHVMKMVKEGN